MKKYLRIINSGLILLVTALSLAGCGDKQNPVHQGKQPMRVPVVRVVPVVPTPIESSVEIVGTISSKRIAKILAPVDGAIEKLYVQENDPVQQNQILAVLSSIERMALLGETQARAEQARRKLWEIGAADNQRDELIKELDAARTDSMYAERLFLGVPVVSPISGRVVDKPIELGSVVNAKQALFTIADLNHLIIQTSISELLLSKVQLGQKIPVKVHAYPQQDDVGTISLINPQVDPATRSVGLEVHIENRRGELKPGMLTTLTFVTERKDIALTVPSDILIIKPNGDQTVFVVKDSTAAERKVMTGTVTKTSTEILQGISAGDKVVVMGQELLKDGMKVKILAPLKQAVAKVPPQSGRKPQ